MGELQLLEYLLHHARADFLVAVERPPGPFLERLGPGFGDIVDERREAEPEVAGCEGHIVDHHARVEEHIFVMVVPPLIHSRHQRDLGENALEQPRVEHQPEPHRGSRRREDFQELFGDSLACNDGEAVAHAGNRLQDLRDYREIQLRGKADRPHHPQGVVVKCLLRVERSAEDPALQILPSVERVMQESDGFPVQ